MTVVMSSMVRIMLCFLIRHYSDRNDDKCEVVPKSRLCTFSYYSNYLCLTVKHKDPCFEVNIYVNVIMQKINIASGQ